MTKVDNFVHLNYILTAVADLWKGLGTPETDLCHDIYVMIYL